MAFKSKGSIWGFHARTLEFAELDQAAWEAMYELNGDQLATTSPDVSEASEELRSWESEQEDANLVENLKPGQIRSFSLNLAQVCNLACSYCGAGGDGTYGDKTPKMDVSIAEQQLQRFLQPLQKGEKFYLRFIGGEPLLYPRELKHLCEYALLQVAGRDVEISFSVVTNGTLINAKVAELLAQFKFAVTVSIDGPKEITDVARPAKNKKSTTEMIEAGLREIAKVRGQLRHLQVNSVFGTHNTDVRRTYNFLNQFGFDTFNFNFAGGTGDDASASQNYIEETNALAQQIVENEGFEALNKIAQFRDIISQLTSRRRQMNHCWAGKSLVQTDSKGNLFACNWFMTDKNLKVGQGTQLDEKALEKYQAPLVEANGCQSCWARHLCGGGCMFYNLTKNGDLNKKDLQFCQRTRTITANIMNHFVKAI